MEERDELKRLREELKALKQAYVDLAPTHKCSEKCIEYLVLITDMYSRKIVG
jgi:hypothetical protein